jgi:hypothetical protein
MKKSLSLSIAALSLALFSGLATAAYPAGTDVPAVNNKPVDPTVCFEDKVVKKVVPANLSSFGGYAVDVQYVNIVPNNNCHVMLNDAAMTQLFSTGNVSTAFSSLGSQTLYGSYTVMGVPRNENNILYKTESNHIITNKKAGDPSDILRFEMLGNDPRLDTRDFNIVLRMKTFTGKLDTYNKPIVDSFTFNVSETFKVGYRNHFLFSKNNQLIYVNVYPLKYPIPKR